MWMGGRKGTNKDVSQSNLYKTDYRMSSSIYHKKFVLVDFWPSIGLLWLKPILSVHDDVESNVLVLPFDIITYT